MNKMPSFFRGKAVLITGASSGIGEELAWQLSQAGAKLTLAARRKELLEKLAQRIVSAGRPRPLVLQCDVTQHGDLEKTVQETLRQWGKLDVAIGNAGFGVVGPIYAALPEIEKNKGNIAIIGSVTGWAATAGSSPYAMSKFAVRALANAITPELRLSGVKVTLISPGFVASDIRRVDNQGNFHEGAKDPIPSWLVMPTEKAVRQMLRAISKGKREAIITGHGKALVFLERFMPWVIRAVARKMAAGRGGYRTEPKGG